MFSFTLILAGLRAVIAVAAARDRTQAAFWVALHTRIGRMGQRLERLIARWRAGTLPAPRASRAGEACASRALPALRFPTSKGWGAGQARLRHFGLCVTIAASVERCRVPGVSGGVSGSEADFAAIVADDIARPAAADDSGCAASGCGGGGDGRDCGGTGFSNFGCVRRGVFLCRQCFDIVI